MRSAGSPLRAALDLSSVENDCLLAMSVPHRGRVLLPHLRDAYNNVFLKLRTEDGAFDITQAVEIELEPGQMPMSDVQMIYGAAAIDPAAAPANRPSSDALLVG